MSEPLLCVRDLCKWFPVRRSMLDRVRRLPVLRVVAVDDVSLDLMTGETLGIVGESGSGKSTLARCLIRLHEPNNGDVRFDGIDVLKATRRQLRDVRRGMQMVFQDPYSSLNPRLSIEKAILEAGLVSGRVENGRRESFASELLTMVGLPAVMADRRPRELSGGQRQRVAIARALAVRPKLIIADEAVSGLDVSVQAQILNLFETLRKELDLTIVFITHQLAVVSHIADRVGVMYLGRIVEYGPTNEIFDDPQHPYTRALLDSYPEPDPTRRREQPAIRGELPSSMAIPTGCRFRTRCLYTEPRCESNDPPLQEIGAQWLVACHVRPFSSPKQASCPQDPGTGNSSGGLGGRQRL